MDSPWVWTIALLAALAAGLFLLGSPRLHRLAERIKAVARARKGRSRND